MSESSPPPQKRSVSISEPSSSPISPLTLTHPAENDSTSRLDTITENVEAMHTTIRSRAKSTPSLSFAVAKPKAVSPTPSPSNSATSLAKASPVVRPRTTSPPPPVRFHNRVSFDNVGHGEPTEHNTISFTLNVKHEGYQYKRQSQTFMVGVDDNPYSDIALQWVLEEMIDDGDQIVCIRVIDKDAKIVNDRALERRKYQQEAKTLMDALQKRNGEQKAINIVLEYAVGKLEDTFLKMIEIYEPSMLIVGTRGRSLGGFQGLMANRNSFSKWCLQFCPIPVVVVRPTEKRMKKKMKRDADPARRDYVRILRESGIDTHETEVTPNTRLFEASNTPHFEAHAVAAALGLPAEFDPTITPIDLPGSTPLRQVDSATSAISATTETTSDSRSPSPKLARTKSPPPKPAEDSGDESAEEMSSDEFEAVPGELLLSNSEEADKKKKLHDMEVGEAAALAGKRKSSIGSVSSVGSGKVAVEEDENGDDEKDEEVKGDEKEEGKENSEEETVEKQEEKENGEKENDDERGVSDAAAELEIADD